VFNLLFSFFFFRWAARDAAENRGGLPFFRPSCSGMAVTTQLHGVSFPPPFSFPPTCSGKANSTLFPFSFPFLPRAVVLQDNGGATSFFFFASGQALRRDGGDQPVGSPFPPLSRSCRPSHQSKLLLLFFFFFFRRFLFPFLKRKRRR